MSDPGAVSERRSSAPVTDLDRSDVVDAPSIVDTAELRWFSAGSAPRSVRSWFTHEGTIGMIEERSDTYLMDGRVDRGVKRRFQKTLEVKVRSSVEERLELTAGLAGRPEVWRKLTPAVDFVDVTEPALWVDVAKVVIKRRFTVDGDEVALSEAVRAQTGAGCDVEVAAVGIGDLAVWSFAFAAFGPTQERRGALTAAWRALCGDSGDPAGFEAWFDLSCGYPEWLSAPRSRGEQSVVGRLGERP
jgi:hypothetical protein